VEVTVQPSKDGATRPARATLEVRPPEATVVTDERYAGLPAYNAPAPGWRRGERLMGVRAFECTAKGALDPASVKVRSSDADGALLFERGRDYELDGDWATLGRLPAGRIGADQPVFISYRFVKLRLDSVVLARDGTLSLRQGEPHIATPLSPAPAGGETRVANIFLNGRKLERLGPDCLFPVLETAFPETEAAPSAAERFLPRTLKKLRDGQRLRILAWGDSVTHGGYLKAEERWQNQFVGRLRPRFPKATVELVTEGWGGRNTASFLEAPPGHEHNFKEKVLGSKPDLVISEFVNDAGLNEKQVEDRYGRLLADFKGIDAEWLILTPHYVFTEWMGLQREREIDEDPRPYVKALRAFAARHGVALADASLRYGRLWRQGLPYSTLMTNTLNHPDARGMRIFADSLMEVFP